MNLLKAQNFRSCILKCKRNNRESLIFYKNQMETKQNRNRKNERKEKKGKTI